MFVFNFISTYIQPTHVSLIACHLKYYETDFSESLLHYKVLDFIGFYILTHIEPMLEMVALDFEVRGSIPVLFKPICTVLVQSKKTGGLKP